MTTTAHRVVAVAIPHAAPMERLPVIGPREESAILTAAGIAVIGTDLWWWHQTWLLIVGLVLTAICAVSLVNELARDPTGGARR